VRDTYFSSDDGRLTMALATRGPGFCTDDVVKAEWELARELDLPITIHVGMGRLAGRFGMVKQLRDLGLLFENTVYVHSCYLDDEEWQLVRDSGGHISVAAQVELQMGHGCPPTGRSRREGLRPSLSIDVVTTVPGDMFTQMRAAFGNERYLVNSQCWQEDVDVPDTMLTVRDVLEMATVNGAEGALLADKVGSLTPGKQADIVLIDGGAPNMAPLMDPVASVVLSADVSNVETVMVGGDIVKRDGKLVGGFDRARGLVEEARDHLVAQVERQPAWSAVS
jgi:5-methylthioadenosine/S-adenosylhomocysteine deaminase